MAVNQSNLPTAFQFKREDFPDADEWFGQFLIQLNLFANPVYNILNGDVTYQNLMAPQLYTTTVTAPAAGDVTFTFTNPLRVQPRGVILGNVYEQGDTTAHPTDPVVVYWHLSQNMIIVDRITNLTASTQYSVTLVVF